MLPQLVLSLDDPKELERFQACYRLSIWENILERVRAEGCTVYDAGYMQHEAARIEGFVAAMANQTGL